jgi:hypothetical protein
MIPRLLYILYFLDFGCSGLGMMAWAVGTGRDARRSIELSKSIISISIG